MRQLYSIGKRQRHFPEGLDSYHVKANSYAKVGIDRRISYRPLLTSRSFLIITAL